ncbi:acyltransferase family protein [Ornithinicoccus hortensis]|uniref:Peptidoglycan/LPS O-acetylase OafA/YrhL n=1 Tax=Ornithinicoccus hortensis TaxID=82346 RepID=A0A542YN11_9MICO|nr:acyltransferase [Ornithinicoccus hortensis]TQL49492.1 peptidoglycan/LPS O-acetylase OafA/YrhL [Ornithinicoccus hortensis]
MTAAASPRDLTADPPGPDAPLRRRFGGLDGMRAVGALMVVLTHVSWHTGASFREPFGGLLARFDAGVAIFFVISGFLLYRPYVAARLTGDEPPRVGRYLWHRALRILPVLWISIAATRLLFDHGTAASQYLRHALLIHIYWPENWVRGLTQMWSLAVEGAFYLALPLLAWALVRTARGPEAYLRRSLLVLGALVLLSPVWTFVAHAVEHPTASQWLPAYLGWFAAGMAMATWQQARCLDLLPAGVLDQLARHPGTLWLAGLAVLAIASTPLAGPRGLDAVSPAEATFKCAAYTLVGALLVFPCVAARRGTEDPRAVRWLGSRVPAWLGDVSYGVFAYHLLVLELVGRAMGLEDFAGGFWWLLLTTLAVSLAVATLSYRYVERPLIRWGREYAERRRRSFINS